MRGHKLGEISKEKDLGIQINQKLSASDQVLEARKRALKMLGAINRKRVQKGQLKW